MSTVTIPFVKPGEIVDLDKYIFDTIDPLQDHLIQTENYRTEAFHKPHFLGDYPETVLYRSISRPLAEASPNYLGSGTFAQVYTDEVVLTTPTVMKEASVLRLHTTMNIIDYDTIGGNKGEFEFAYYWDIGAGYVRIPDSPAYRYGAAPLDRDGAAPWDPRKNWRIGFSYCKPLEAQITLSKVAVFYRWIDTWDFWIDWTCTTLLHFRN